ncbi:hypothetical protein FRC03_010202 [Tulasnella sp. 419]|nr:hypothetical protein FRC03_010202 [Tulasnella sp. 419]
MNYSVQNASATIAVPEGGGERDGGCFSESNNCKYVVIGVVAGVVLVVISVGVVVIYKRRSIASTSSPSEEANLPNPADRATSATLATSSPVNRSTNVLTANFTRLARTTRPPVNINEGRSVVVELARMDSSNSIAHTIPES